MPIREIARGNGPHAIACGVPGPLWACQGRDAVPKSAWTFRQGFQRCCPALQAGPHALPKLQAGRIDFVLQSAAAFRLVLDAK